MPDVFTDYLTIALGCSGFLLLAVWLVVGIWTFRDARSRSRSGAAAVLATVMVLLIPIAGLVIYLLLRPRETLTEAYDRALEQEALLQQIEEPLSCPGCSRRVSEAWVVCPDCRTQLRQPCASCAQPLDLRWTICPYCMTEVTRSALSGLKPGAVEEEMPAAAAVLTDPGVD